MSRLGAAKKERDAAHGQWRVVFFLKKAYLLAQLVS